jgi:hypothetical protein
MSVHDGTDGSAAAECRVTAHQSGPDRVVFTEADNTDGWIATDYTEPLER